MPGDLPNKFDFRAGRFVSFFDHQPARFDFKYPVFGIEIIIPKAVSCFLAEIESWITGVYFSRMGKLFVKFILVTPALHFGVGYLESFYCCLAHLFFDLCCLDAPIRIKGLIPKQLLWEIYFWFMNREYFPFCVFNYVNPWMIANQLYFLAFLS